MQVNKDSGSFNISSGFCPDCGTILPFTSELGEIACYSCERNWRPEDVFGQMEVSFNVKFRDSNTFSILKDDENLEEEKPEGPVVERQCPQCKNNQMSYATMQLRSADEGQTVFYTCTKCKFKEVENS